MKYFITVFLLLFVGSARAQITLEHSYESPGDIGLVQVDSARWKYVESSNNTITIFNIDHSMDRQITIPWSQGIAGLIVIAKGLFSTDTDYCYLVSFTEGGGVFSGLRVFKEDGIILFSCDSCNLWTNNSFTENTQGLNGYFPPAIKSTSSGTKMFITTAFQHSVDIYSLPGKLPTCSTTALSGVNPSIAYTNPTLPTFAFPNPSSSSVRIAYELPSGVSSGDLILTTEDGREVRRYRVTSAFSDLLIESGDLPSGSYFYKVVTAKGGSGVQRISIEK